MIKEAIIKLSKKEDLTYDEAEAVMNEIMDGAATPVQMASYLTALSLKGETIDEITASAAGTPPAAITREDVVEMLKEFAPSPPVPTISRTSISWRSLIQCALIPAADAVISSIVSPFRESAVR